MCNFKWVYDFNYGKYFATAKNRELNKKYKK